MEIWRFKRGKGCQTIRSLQRLAAFEFGFFISRCSLCSLRLFFRLCFAQAGGGSPATSTRAADRNTFVYRRRGETVHGCIRCHRRIFCAFEARETAACSCRLHGRGKCFLVWRAV
jgi:hypothetical protein